MDTIPESGRPVMGRETETQHASREGVPPPVREMAQAGINPAVCLDAWNRLQDSGAGEKALLCETDQKAAWDLVFRLARNLKGADIEVGRAEDGSTAVRIRT